jgi:hypothetical protein
MKSSFHSLITFLPLFCNCRLSSIPLLLAGCRLETRPNWTLLYNHFAQTTQRTRPNLDGVFTAPLHCNGSYSTVACVFVAAGMCLPSRCIAMNVYSDVANPVFGRHVTIFSDIRSFRKVSASRLQRTPWCRQLLSWSKTRQFYIKRSLSSS